MYICYFYVLSRCKFSQKLSSWFCQALPQPNFLSMVRCYSPLQASAPSTTFLKVLY